MIPAGSVIKIATGLCSTTCDSRRDVRSCAKMCDTSITSPKIAGFPSCSEAMPCPCTATACPSGPITRNSSGASRVFPAINGRNCAPTISRSSRNTSSRNSGRTGGREPPERKMPQNFGLA
jgi:hypothetical protein